MRLWNAVNDTAQTTPGTGSHELLSHREALCSRRRRWSPPARRPATTRGAWSRLRGTSRSRRRGSPKWPLTPPRTPTSLPSAMRWAAWRLHAGSFRRTQAAWPVWRVVLDAAIPASRRGHGESLVAADPEALLTSVVGAPRTCCLCSVRSSQTARSCSSVRTGSKYRSCSSTRCDPGMAALVSLQGPDMPQIPLLLS